MTRTRTSEDPAFGRASRLEVLAGAAMLCAHLAPAPVHAATGEKKPNIVVIWGDDIGQSNISANTHGLMGYQTLNIDRIAKEGRMFTDYYAEQSCRPTRRHRFSG